MYPPIEPYNTGYLQVDEVHKLYYEECGNKDGIPALVVHGGPGAGTMPPDRQMFDPEAYRIILLDQRGAGKSEPTASLKDNTTWHLVADLERVREHLGVDKWILVGESWGSTLSLAYAEKHPDRVRALVLSGVFTARSREIDWLYQDGCNHLFPDVWQTFIEQIPEGERRDLVGAYYRRLTGEDEQVRVTCAQSWSRWELSILFLEPNPYFISLADDAHFCHRFAVLECHYMTHGCFMERDDQLIGDAGKLKDIPTTIINGRYDVVCPLETAWLLHQAMPQSELKIIPAAGHKQHNNEITQAIVAATDKYRTLKK